MIELRDFDKKTIVVYTDDRQVANALMGWREFIKQVPYAQQQGATEVLIGVDVYLPKTPRIMKRLQQFPGCITTSSFPKLRVNAKRKKRLIKIKSNSKG